MWNLGMGSGYLKSPNSKFQRIIIKIKLLFTHASGINIKNSQNKTLR
jgi:hypothetical protein